MGSKVQIIDQECERHYGKIGYVCEWKHRNQDGKTFVTVYVQFLDDTDGWFDAESVKEI